MTEKEVKEVVDRTKSLELQIFMLNSVLDEVGGYLQDAIDSKAHPAAERSLIRKIEEARSVR